MMGMIAFANCLIRRAGLTLTSCIHRVCEMATVGKEVSTERSRRRSETDERLCWFWEDGMFSHMTRALGVCCTLTMLVYAQAAFSEEVKDYGKPGSPIELVVGYQPYYTESWSGVIMRSKK